MSGRDVATAGDALAYRSASGLAAALRGGSVGSRALLEHYLARIARLNPAINAVVTLDAERARARADLADAATARGENWGPLHGLPMTVKDLFETAGLRTTAGALPDHVPAANAVAVQRLVDAGAIVFGKTNVSPFGADVQSANPIFGATNNPWDRARSPGGSSGGAAAALAAGLTPLELGSDLAASLRLPAHFCGIYAHRPSHGLVSLRGHIPGSLGEPDIATAGPLARDAADLALALDVLAAPPPEQAGAWRLRLPPARHATLGAFRVAAWFEDPGCPVERAVLARCRGVVAALRAAGATVDDTARPAFDFAHAYRHYVTLLLSLTSAALPAEQFALLARHAAGLAPDDDGIAAAYLRGTTLRHRDWLVANEARLRLRAAWADFFERHDVLLCPVAPTVAIAHDHSEPLHERLIDVDGRAQSYLTLMAWTGIVGVAHLPATVAPVGLSDGGLPVGIQIVGPYLEDRTPIAFAGLLASLTGGFTAPPGY